MQPTPTDNKLFNDVHNLCSRKLFELLATRNELSLNSQQLQSIERELIARQHYLHELNQLRSTY